MKPNAVVEDGLEALGATLRARPRLTERVMHEVRRLAANHSTEEPSTLAPRPRVHRRRQLLAAAFATVGTVSAALLIALALFPSPSVGWADVTKAIQSQKWIRGTATYPDGGRATIWLSPQGQIWAFRLEPQEWSQFFDGQQRAKYEYRRGGERITRLLLGEEEARRSSLFDGLSQDETRLPPWLFGEKIVSQKQRRVMKAGKTWIEFQLVLWRGPMNQATLRVDPDTKLPVYALFASPDDATQTYKWQFDYPADGPTDIYALGVPREMKIDDRMPSDHALRVLNAMAASRARIGDFRLLVARHPGDPGSIVWRKKDRWRVDLCLGEIGYRPMAEPAEGQSWADWLADRLKQCRQVPLYVCDGKTVYENTEPLTRATSIAASRTVLPSPVYENTEQLARATWQRARFTAPQDLLSGEGLGGLPRVPYVKIASLVYPDLSPKPGWGFEFDPQPAELPGCVLIKRSARTTQKEPTVAHEWYYIDPAKGHAVVRIELFTLPPDTVSGPECSRSRQTLRMERFQQSPHGFWYCTVVHETNPAIAGNDQPATATVRSPDGAIQQVQSGNRQPVATTVRYYFDFDADLPDSLFTVDDVQVPNQ